MAIVFQQGTKEYVMVDVVDETGALTTLSGTTPQFTVMDANDTPKYTNQAATNTNMRAFCLIDTLNGGAWAAGIYRLWLRFTVGSEVPYIGPFEFEVQAP